MKSIWSTAKNYFALPSMPIQAKAVREGKMFSASHLITDIAEA